MPIFLVEISADETHERELLRYESESQPEVGETITVGDVRAVVEREMRRPGDVLLECRRLEPAE